MRRAVASWVIALWVSCSPWAAVAQQPTDIFPERRPDVARIETGHEMPETERVGRCSLSIRRHGIFVSGEGSGRPFRGLGGPFQGSAVSYRFTGSSISAHELGSDFAGAVEIGVRSVIGNLPVPGRSCFILEGRVPVPVRGTLDGEYRLGSPVISAVVLFRSPLDTFRVHVAFDYATPTVGSHVRSALAVQSGFHLALAMAPDDELMWLPQLDYGGIRGRLGLEAQSYEALSPFFAIELRLGYAQIQSAIGARDGLVGGARIGAGIQYRAPNGPFLGWGARGGVRARVGYGALWPTDILLPFYVGGEFSLGVPPIADTRIEVEFSFGAVFPNFVLNDTESYARGTVAMRFAWDAAPAEPDERVHPPRPQLEEETRAPSR